MRPVVFMLSASILALGSASVASAHGSGVYIRGNAGLGVHTDPELTGDVTSQVHDNGLQSQSDLAGSLGLGYEFDNNWRVELDADTLFTDLGSIGGTPRSFGKLRTNSLMLNAIYDFADLGNWEPYVGAGLGLVQAEGSFAAQDFAVNGLAGANPACIGPRADDQVLACAIQDKDTAFGWQALAGLGYNISDNLTWDTHLTYMDAGDFDFEGARNVINATGVTPGALSSTLSDVGLFSVMTGLRYKFGHTHDTVRAAPPPPPPPPIPVQFTCFDGTVVTDRALCPTPPPPPPPVQSFTCSDGVTQVTDLALCPPPPPPPPVIVEPAPQSFVCADGQTVVSDLSSCPVVQSTNLNVCSDSSVAIFNVPASTQFKQVSRLGTYPEFGDSHDLTPGQFYDKLNAAYNSNAGHKAYLNYLSRSMGYSGWRDVNASMFSNDVLPVGTRGILGLGEQHHYEFKILPTSDRDRQAFRIQSANGQVVHFMKTCGNYFYGCQ